jgi:arylsulfatase A-like enzyme
LIAAWIWGVAAVTPPAAYGPNILFINADNWAYPHAGCYGEPQVRTPNFDRLAREGVLFQNAFCVVPSCTPARGVMLTGRPMHALGEGASLWGALPRELTLYTDLLEAAGYAVGYSGKGWSPGKLEPTGRTRNPAGEQFQSFDEFLARLPAERPFCYWHGDTNTARNKIVRGAGRAAGFDPTKVRLPPRLPDAPEVRDDVADYFAAVERMDAAFGESLKSLEASGRAANTLVVIAGDNGWQFPGGLANVYDTGTHVPLVIRWPGKAKAGTTIDEFVDFTDLAPTFLAVAGLRAPPEMIGRSLVPLLRGDRDDRRKQVFLERERHANVREGHVGYPVRAVRTSQFLYVRNFEPTRNPAGDPILWFSVEAYGDCDASPTKEFVLSHRDDDRWRPFFEFNFGLRPAEELYDLRVDPGQIHNVAGDPRYRTDQANLRAMLDDWMRDTGDPRAHNPRDPRWDRYPYYGVRKPGATAPRADWEVDSPRKK